MEQTIQNQSQSMTAAVCATCHQLLLPEYYFCPNCGKQVHEAPLKTDVLTQTWIYIFSIILPMMCFLFVTRWPGMKYVKSQDEKAKQIGQVAWFLIIVSTIFSIWFAVVWTENFAKQVSQSTADSINTDFSGL
jgi:RNA polymerase subunit RPABC4/transcription elongation factor Spt4